MNERIICSGFYITVTIVLFAICANGDGTEDSNHSQLYTLAMNTTDIGNKNIANTPDILSSAVKLEVFSINFLRFEVKACADVQVYLVSSSSSMYGLTIGADDNVRSLMEKREGNGTTSTMSTVNGAVLDCDDFTPLWISWENGEISFGKGNTTNQNIIGTWTDSNPLTVDEIAVATGHGTSGEWRFLVPRIFPCKSTLCQNGGTCVSDGDTFHCDCNAGYEGIFCQNEHPVTIYRVGQGENVKLLCSHASLTDIHWLRTINGKATYLNTSDQTKYSDGTIDKPSLCIYKLDFPDGEGEYSCWTNSTDGVVKQGFMKIYIEGVKLECGSLSRNSVYLEYHGFASEVVFRGGDKECAFTPQDTDLMNSFSINVGLVDNYNNDSRCYFQRDSLVNPIYLGQVNVRSFLPNVDTTDDFSYDLRCFYTMIAESTTTIELEQPKVSAPIMVSQPSGPKSESSYTVGLRTHDDKPLTSPRTGDFVIFKAVMTAAPGDKAFTISNCEIFSDDRKKVIPILTNGCGTGWPFPKNKGFTMTGMEGKSPIFKLFQIKRGSKLNISCNFFVCKDVCDGDTCSK